MIVFCPGCGSKISVEPASPGGNVECPRCHSTFATAGLKSADDAPQPNRYRPKKTGRSKLAVTIIVATVLLVVLGGTGTALFFTGHLGRWFGASSTTGGPNQPSWQEYTNAEGRFSAVFPGSVTREALKSRSGKVQAVTFSASAAGATYTVAFQDLTANQTPEQVIDQSRSELGGGKGGNLVKEKDVTTGSNKGKEFMVEAPGQGTVHMRFFAAGKRLYKLSVVGTPAKSPDLKDVARFFESWRITG